MKNIYSLLLLLICITACNGQEKTNPSNVSDTPKTAPPKMIRTQGVKSGNVMCELQDKAGNLWFSTGGEGVYRYDGTAFTNFTEKDGLCDNNVGAIIQDKAGNIVFATRSGICKYDGKTFTRYAALDTFNTVGINSLLEDRNGNLWFGTMGQGIYRYNPSALSGTNSETLTNFLKDDDPAFNLGEHYQLILDILEDKNGNLWFSSWNRGGVWKYDGKTFTNYLPSANYYQPKPTPGDGSAFYGRSENLPQPTIIDDMIFSILEDRAGNLWFATRNHGACRYDGHSFLGFSEYEGFVSTGVYSMAEDKKGNIWFTTEKNGVFRYDGKTFQNFTTQDGLIHNSVFSVLEDNAGNLWFGTRGFGLSRYDGKTFTTFSGEAGQ